MIMAEAGGADDCIFDEEEDDSILAAKEWKKIELARLNDGLRDGMSEGQERILQQSFNESYKVSASLAFQLAKLRGILSALLGYHLLQNDKLVLDAKWKDRIEDMISNISEAESGLTTGDSDIDKLPDGAPKTCDGDSQERESCSSADSCLCDIYLSEKLKTLTAETRTILREFNLDSLLD